MKKKIMLLLLLFIITGCTNKELVNETKNGITPTVTPTPTEIPYIDNNPVKVGLYQNGNLVKELTTTINDGLDIGSFDVYFTNVENTGSSNTKNNFNKYYQEYDNKELYKIGFYISFYVGDELKEGTILGPKDMYIVTPYIYNYLYDDIHQPDGAWYSHVEEKDIKDNTVYSSIKLYAAEKTNEITSPITLTVFTYDTEDDFDKSGKYRGNSKYTITIKKR